MQQTIITAELRDKAGVRGTLSALRAAGRVPAVIYGLEDKPVSISVDSKEILAVYKNDANAVITLKHDGKEDTVIIKSIQRHPVTNKFHHLDFQRISLTEKVEVKVPVKLVGEAPGVKLQGGLLEHNLRELLVFSLPMDIPHEIEVDISKLNINESIRVKDVQSKVQILDASEQIIVSVAVAKDEVVETPAAAATTAAEPEVAATKGKKPEEGAAPPAADAKAAPAKAAPAKK